MSAFTNEGRGNGYNWYLGKSNNAVAAEGEGKYPATTIAKMYHIESMAVSELLPWTEWHHTSGAFNKTYYYDIEDVEANIEALKARSKALRARRKKHLQDHHTFYDCTVTWTETVKDGRRFKEVDRFCKASKVIGRGQTVTVYPSDGSPKFTKRACRVSVHSSRGLEDKAGILAESIIRECGKREKYQLSASVSADIAPYHNLVSIDIRAAKSLAKRNMQVKQGFALANENSRRIKQRMRNEEAFKKAQIKQIKREFLSMLKDVFGTKIEVHHNEHPSLRRTSTTIKVTTKMYSTDRGYFVRFGENYGIKAGMYAVQMKNVLKNYLNGQPITEIELNGTEDKIKGVEL